LRLLFRKALKDGPRALIDLQIFRGEVFSASSLTKCTVNGLSFAAQMLIPVYLILDVGRTALDLSFCIRGGDDAKQPGFYLIMAMGSEQAGLTGVKGSIVRKAAVGRSVSNLQNALTTIRNTLEGR
jgi:hypothetical protein